MRRLVKTWAGQKKVLSSVQWEALCKVFPQLEGRRYAELDVGGEIIRLRVVHTDEGVLVWTE